MQPFISQQNYYFKRFSDGRVFIFISDCREIPGSHSIGASSPVEPQHKRKVGYKCNFFAENHSLGVADSESVGCHFGTLGQFF